MKKSLRSYLLTGLIVWMPILVTFAVLRFIVDLLDKTIALLPQSFRPEAWLGVYIPGVGVILSLLLLFITGIVATNILGQRFMLWSESILDRIPLVRTIYNGTKQVIQAIFSTQGQSFRQVLLLEYPRKDCWTLAFQTSVVHSDLNAHMGGEMVTAYVPTTPNPTSGFLIVVPRQDVIELAMSVDEALKFIISLGVMQPESPTAFKVNNPSSEIGIS